MPHIHYLIVNYRFSNKHAFHVRYMYTAQVRLETWLPFSYLSDSCRGSWVVTCCKLL